MKLICCCNWSLGLKACRVRLYCRLQQGQWHCRTVFKVNILQPYCPHLHTEKLNRKIPFNFVCFPPHQKVTGWCFICIRLQFTWITLISIKCILKVRSLQWSIVQCYAVTLQLQLQLTTTTQCSCPVKPLQLIQGPSFKWSHNLSITSWQSTSDTETPSL